MVFKPLSGLIRKRFRVKVYGDIYIYICIYTHLPNPGNEPKSPALEVDSLPSKPPGKPIHSPGGASGKEPTCQSRRYKRCGFNPWVGKIPWRRAWQPTPAFLLRESPWAEEPDRLQPTGLQRVGDD